MPEQLSDWIDRARQGDEAAFAALYDRFERSIHSLCHHLLDDPDEADDAVQETFVTVWQNLPRLRHNPAFSTWLRGAAVNVCRHRQRKHRWLRPFSALGRGEEPPEPVDPAPDAADNLARQDLSAHVRQALHQLSEPHREVIVLHHLEGLPLDEIAASLGVAVGTVKSRLGRARGHLERLLLPYLSEE